MFGYDSEVILPMRVIPIDATKSVRLHLAVDYGICQKVCIPNKERFSVELAREQPAENRLPIVQALEKVPKRSMTLLKTGGTLSGETLSFDLDAPQAFDFAILEYTSGQASHVIFPTGQHVTKIVFRSRVI